MELIDERSLEKLGTQRTKGDVKKRVQLTKSFPDIAKREPSTI